MCTRRNHHLHHDEHYDHNDLCDFLEHLFPRKRKHLGSISGIDVNNNKE